MLCAGTLRRSIFCAQACRGLIGNSTNLIFCLSGDWDGRFESQGGSWRLRQALRASGEFGVAPWLLGDHGAPVGSRGLWISGDGYRGYGRLWHLHICRALIGCNPESYGHQRTALFWINLLVGMVLLCLATAPVPVAHEPRLFLITVAIGTGFFCSLRRGCSIRRFFNASCGTST